MVVLLLLSGVSMAQDVVLEFQQWWEPELPAGSFRAILDDFEAANPGIRVETISGPYLTTKDQIIASAATGTMADVVGLGWRLGECLVEAGRAAQPDAGHGRRHVR